MTPLQAFFAIPLWAAAGAFVAVTVTVTVVRVIRDLRKPTDPENGEYQ